MDGAQIGDFKIFGLSPDSAEFLQRWAAFVERYCAEHGLDKATMTIQQILKMREEEGWKNPK